jgi:predicted secreted protein
MAFTDNRGKRIVYVNNCMLNQNARFPAAAIRKGAFTEFIQILLNNGLSIEQLPCLECIAMGGVSRKSYFSLQPLLSNSVEKGWFPIVKPVVNAWWRIWFKWACRKQAARVVNRMQDYLREGFEIVGVVSVNDSPTCGVTKTLDFIEFIRRAATLRDVDNLQMKKLIQDTLVDGRGAFIDSMRKKLDRKGLDVKVIPFEPWAEPQEEETRRVAGLLDL